MTKKRCIINTAICSNTSWYLNGQKRLSDSLLQVKEEAEQMFSSYESPLKRSVYEDKVFSIQKAGMSGYRQLLWLDCSITAIKKLDEIWKYIEKNGYYLYASGGNCAETCNDNSLIEYGITRDQAEKIHECASNVVGINLDHPNGQAFFDLWTGSLKNSSNIGNKWPKNETERQRESMDKRFKYHRQDQSTASLSAGLLNLKIESEGHFVVRHENIEARKTKQTVFVLKGGY